MTNITKAAQDMLDAFELYMKQYPHMAKGYTEDAASALRAALQDKAVEVVNYEPAGFLLHWPAPGGGREILWSKDGAAGRAIGCPVTEVFKLKGGA